MSKPTSGSDAERLAAVLRLADAWNEIPDYTATEYDQGRVDQRHDMLGELLEVLNPPRTLDEDRQVLAEEGRQLASRREDLIAQGVDPAELEIPLHPRP